MYPVRCMLTDDAKKSTISCNKSGAIARGLASIASTASAVPGHLQAIMRQPECVQRRRDRAYAKVTLYDHKLKQQELSVELTVSTSLRVYSFREVLLLKTNDSGMDFTPMESHAPMRDGNLQTPSTRIGTRSGRP